MFNSAQRIYGDMPFHQRIFMSGNKGRALREDQAASAQSAMEHEPPIVVGVRVNRMLSDGCLTGELPYVFSTSIEPA